MLKSGHSKWMLEGPRINFAITGGSTTTGPDHLGVQVESDEDLAVITGLLEATDQSVAKQQNASCCYARGNEGRGADPSRISWETFHTFGESTVYGTDIAPRLTPVKASAEESCRAPAPTTTNSCGSASKAY